MLFIIMLYTYQVVLSLESVDEILKSGNSNESYKAVFARGTGSGCSCCARRLQLLSLWMYRYKLNCASSLFEVTDISLESRTPCLMVHFTTRSVLTSVLSEVYKQTAIVFIHSLS